MNYQRQQMEEWQKIQHIGDLYAHKYNIIQIHRQYMIQTKGIFSFQKEHAIEDHEKSMEWISQQIKLIRKTIVS